MSTALADDFDFNHVDILPDCRAKNTKNRVIDHRSGTCYVPIFCANCGAPGGGVPEENMTFAFFLCSNCDHLGEVAGMMAVPEEKFWQKVKQEQIEKHGRLLSLSEVFQAVNDESNPLSKLAREAPKGK